MQLIDNFESLRYRREGCFSSKPWASLSSGIWVKECVDRPYVTDLMKCRFLCKLRFNVADWLNSGVGQTTIRYRIIETVLPQRKRLRPVEPFPRYVE